MAKKDRIREIQDVLDSYHKLTYNKLKKIVVKKRLMAAQTFTDALKEGVESGIITREEGFDIGKRKAVWYSKPENAKKEDDYFQILTSDADSFGGRLEVLEQLFSELDNIEKGQILFSFIDWYYAIQAQIALGHSLFNSTKFADLAKHMFSSIQDLEKLALRGSEKQQSIIWNELQMEWNDVERHNGDIIDELLDVAIGNSTKPFSDRKKNQ